LKKKLLTPQETAKYLSSTKGTIYFWVNKNKIPYVKVNGTLRFDIDDLNAWIKKNKVEARSRV